MLDTVPHIVYAMFTLFTYVTDMEQYGVEDNWRSHAVEVRAGKHFKDDCDGFALTAVDLLHDIHIKAHTMIVKAPKLAGGTYHMIAVFTDPVTHEEMTIDNRYPGTRTLEKTMSGSMYTPY